MLTGGHLLDPLNGSWTVVPDPPWPARRGQVVVGGENTILVWGGADDAANLATGYLLRL